MLVELCQYEGQSELPRWLASRGKIFKIWVSRYPKKRLCQVTCFPNCIEQGVNTSWKSWKWPGIFFCPKICPGVLLFQCFVFEMFWNFFCTIDQIFFHSHYFCILPLAIYLVFSKFVYFDHIPCYHFFSFQKIIDMAKYNCIFDHDWLIEFEWVEKGPNARTAYCYPCHHTCDISSMGRSAVTSHSKGKKHKDNEISRKSLLILFFAKKKSCESYCVRFRSKGNVHLLHSHL